MAAFRAFRAPGPLTVAHQGLGSARILIVDDEPFVATFIQRALSGAGNTSTAVALSGEEALRIAEQFRPFDLLLTDVMMPGIHGDELARRLRKQDPDLKVLYLTGFSDELFKERLTLSEGEAYLDKPTTVAGIREAVTLLLDRPPRRRVRAL